MGKSKVLACLHCMGDLSIMGASSRMGTEIDDSLSVLPIVRLLKDG